MTQALALPIVGLSQECRDYIPLHPPQKGTFAIDWRRITFTKLMSNHEIPLVADNSQIPFWMRVIRRTGEWKGI